ncbi:tripartite tricarboxylate transporter substrate binding protein [uncultured Azohydromonas sp.]|uniref:tripartite tricarboxylate transporter substrate binding protein n=1 Tax=uncultured Azohydromonas sp. TaxID=487342 RepID=UPI00261D2699|nr:tripartite tricarboxylate transporter substrate binding protein [uncultured Azohydromonas sp.]
MRIVVGYQAGGPTDVVARLLASRLQAQTGQPFIVENKAGAGSNLASEVVASSAPDGYTLLLAAAPITMASFVYKGLKWDVQGSFEPISMVMSAPAILAVAPHLPAKNVQELVALAKKKPGELTFGSTGNGGTHHVAGEMFKQRAGIDLIHVPYKGAAGAIQDVMAGHVSLSLMTSVSAVPFIKDNKVRALAVAAPKRLPQLPNVPTMAEAGMPGFEVDSWNGLLAPKGTSPAIVEKLHAEVVKALADAEMRAKLIDQGAIVVGSSPADFKAHIRKEVDHWAKLFPTINVKID